MRNKLIAVTLAVLVGAALTTVSSASSGHATGTRQLKIFAVVTGLTQVDVDHDAKLTTVSSASSGHATGTRQLKIFAVVTGLTQVDVDHDAKLSTGDEVIVRAQDYDKQGGTVIGTGTVVCVAVDADAGNFDCQGSDVLAGGEIREAGRVVGADPSHFHWAVVGGTRKYRGVSGQLDGSFVDTDLTNAALVFTFVDR